jgi:hypothetical protein
VGETECEVVVVEGRDECESAEWSAEDEDDSRLDLELIYLDAMGLTAGSGTRHLKQDRTMMCVAWCSLVHVHVRIRTFDRMTGRGAGNSDDRNLIEHGLGVDVTMSAFRPESCSMSNIAARLLS